MLKRIEGSTLFGLAAVILIAIGATEFYKDNIAPRFSRG